MEISEKYLLLENYLNKDVLDSKLYEALILFLASARERDRHDPKFFLHFPELIRVYQDDELMDKVGRCLDDAYLKFRNEVKAGKLEERDIWNIEKEISIYNFILARLNSSSNDKRNFSHLIGISHDLYRPKEQSLKLVRMPSLISELEGDKNHRKFCEDFIFKAERFDKGRLPESVIEEYASLLEKGKLALTIVYLQNAFDKIKLGYQKSKIEDDSYHLSCHQMVLINHFLDELKERAKKINPELDVSSFQVLDK